MEYDKIMVYNQHLLFKHSQSNSKGILKKKNPKLNF